LCSTNLVRLLPFPSPLPPSLSASLCSQVGLVGSPADVVVAGEALLRASADLFRYILRVDPPALLRAPTPPRSPAPSRGPLTLQAPVRALLLAIVARQCDAISDMLTSTADMGGDGFRHAAARYFVDHGDGTTDEATELRALWGIAPPSPAGPAAASSPPQPPTRLADMVHLVAWCLDAPAAAAGSPPATLPRFTGTRLTGTQSGRPAALVRSGGTGWVGVGAGRRVSVMAGD